MAGKSRNVVEEFVPLESSESTFSYSLAREGNGMHNLVGDGSEMDLRVGVSIVGGGVIAKNGHVPIWLFDVGKGRTKVGVDVPLRIESNAGPGLEHAGAQ
jgi:hypothetical protein